MAPFKLGKLPATHDHRDLRFARYATGTLPYPSSDTRAMRAIKDWGMLANDRLGNCVFAGACHETMLWTLEGTGAAATFTDTEAISSYSAVTGYTPGDDSTDQGTLTRDALGYRRSLGLRDAAGVPHKIDAYAAITPGNIEDIKRAIYYFDVVGIGIEFPDSAMEQFNDLKPWSLRRGESTDGGHYIPLVGYDRRYAYCVTWGRLQPMTWAFYRTYCDEAWVLLSSEFLKAGKSPDGFDIAALRADLTIVTS